MHNSKLYAAFLLTSLFFMGCQQKPSTTTATAANKTTTQSVVLAVKLAEFHALTREEPPKTNNWCVVLKWNNELTDFTWVNQPLLERAGYRDEISAEFDRRGKVRNRALLTTLQKSPVVPDCHFREQVYDPVQWIAYAQDEKHVVPDALVLAAAKEITKEHRFQSIHAENWEARTEALQDWRGIIDSLSIKKNDLPRLGLSAEEIRQIFWFAEHPRSHAE